MAPRPSTAGKLGRLWTTGRMVLAVLGGLCILAIAFLSIETVRELRFLNSARSDNVHWVMSQAEVEFLDFRNAIVEARMSPSEAELDELIVEFDVFYSRMATLGTATTFEALREVDSFGVPVAEIRDRLAAMIPLIDGDRDVLRAALPGIGEQLVGTRLLLRQAATAALHHFVELSDQSRERFALTLRQLALFALGLLLALAALLLRTRQVSAQFEQRGIELAQAYARQNTILETSLDAVIVSDMQGKILNFNSAAVRIFGHDETEAVGRNISDLIVPAHLRPAHDAGMARLRSGEERRVVGQGRVRLEAMRRSGEIFPVELALEKAQAGEDEVIVAFLRDISVRITAERELVAARDRALAGERAKADFLAMMTHEIRTPLNGLLGNLALIGKTELSPEQGRFVRNMDISGKLLMHHVDAVLDVARFESGASVVSEEVTHLGTLVEDIVQSQLSAAEASGNRVEWGWVDAPRDWVRIDASRLQQILLNLLGNAIKFTKGGRITIE